MQRRVKIMLKISILERSIVGVLSLFWLVGCLLFFVCLFLGFCFASPRSCVLCLPLNVDS